MKKSPRTAAESSASKLISERIAELADWRGKTLSRMRKLIHEADPDVVEEWKWMGTPIFSREGIICTGESYKAVVKLTFAKGASLADPKRLFNSSMEGNARRAIDIREGEQVDAAAFKALVREAIALNLSRAAKPAKRKTPDAERGSAKGKLPKASPAGSSRRLVPVAKKSPANKSAKKATLKKHSTKGAAGKRPRSGAADG
ncbi:MAG: hypothetical protein K0R38_4526 [Polyangiaceae bacterium]|jgi:hypothetical protein|nr:hypothetical protein [Polyangiaceae bacterium]